mgnify:CR=1 FL=1
MKKLLTILTVFTCSLLASALAEKDEHGHGLDHAKKKQLQKTEYSDLGEHKHDAKEAEEDHKHGEDEKETHEEHEDHDENARVGPGKGILEASEADGIKLSPEAEKNFGIARQKITSLASIGISKTTVVTAVAEVNVFRYRNGFYKRIDFEEVSRSQDKIAIRSKDLKMGDEIVIDGLGYLRIAEIAAFGGAPEGHSH